MNVLIGIVIGGIVLALVESRHQGITAALTVAPVPVYRPPQQQPQQYMVGSTAVDAAENVGLQNGLAALNAIPVVGQAISSVASAILGPLLAAHRQRMKDATTENQRVSNAVPSFYDKVIKIVNYYNAGRITKAEATQALLQLDNDTYTSLREFVGSPGTAWNSNLPGVCDKSCTVGCCIYNTWLHPDIVSVPGRKGVIPLMSTGGSKVLGGIPTNKYAFVAYPAVPITVRKS